MLTDLTLASLHHLLVFGLVSMLVAQAVLLRGRMDGAVLAKLGGIDRGYGITALSLLVVGFLRVFHGVMGEDFYLHNPWFHARTEEHTSELQYLRRISYAVFCFKKK